MRKQALHLDNLQEVLDSAKNSKTVGTQQFETSFDIALALCTVLPAHRPTITDFQCGHGALLDAAANKSTANLIGIDIDPTCRAGSKDVFHRERVVADFTQFYPMLNAVKAKFDLLVLNPPYSLQWASDRFACVPNIKNWVRSAAFGKPGARKAPAIDSTLATYLCAIESLSDYYGEGMMICNNATCERLIEPILASQNIWLKVVLPNFFPGTVQDMEIAVLYFAKIGTGKNMQKITLPNAHPDTIRLALRDVHCPLRDRLYGGIATGSVQPVQAAKAEFQRIHEAKVGAHGGFNIYFDSNKQLRGYLTPFQNLSGTISREVVDELQKLDGRRIMELVIMRDTREILSRAVTGGVWRVHPDVPVALTKALTDYETARAPLTPLSPIHRLGYLDENEEIECRVTDSAFTAGQSYPLTSETVAILLVECRKKPQYMRHTPDDSEETVETSGQDLLIRIRDAHGNWHGYTQHPIGIRPDCHALHRLPELLKTFVIPAVKDVAEIQPERFAHFTRKLMELEAA